ncbi:hypothetical protein EVAR_70382_1 [Eumeta japonica]|uniref:Mos1 transposase HTH domain-containing protein n=1 Tax=Eumeta variegata TaxID=151549 RepID=A0A4C2A387_EUMVA|nr:hypothetical protein EVAR_70382_1 [Eumeta japonica]
MRPTVDIPMEYYRMSVKPIAVQGRVAQNWFKHFQSGNFDVKDEPRSGRPVTDEVQAILEKVEPDQVVIAAHGQKLGAEGKGLMEEVWGDGGAKWTTRTVAH